MVSVLVPSAVDRGFATQSGQSKNYPIGIFSFFAKLAIIWNDSKDWLARYQDNVSVGNDMSTRRLLF